MNDISPTPALTAEPVDYERDFAQWIARQAELLRAKDFEHLDVDNLVEEIEDMGKSLRRELHSRLEVLILHLLKCEFQPERKTSSWVSTLHEQRNRILHNIEQSPSLGRLVPELSARAYAGAVRRAAVETGLPVSTFPRNNPYPADALLDVDFVP
jgi:hypothetical protein